MSRASKVAAAEPLTSNGECCPVMSLALTRSAERTDPVGLYRDNAWNFRTGKERPITIIKWRKQKLGPKTEYSDVTWAEVAFCPFCGAQQKGKDDK